MQTRNLISILIIILSGILLFAQEPDIEWIKILGGPREDVGYSIFETPDGGYMIGGRTKSTPDGWQDLFLMKINGNGDSLWTKLFGTPGISESYAGIHATDDGGYIIIGLQPKPMPSWPDIWLVKTDGDGNQQWENWVGADTVSETPFCGIQSSDGGYVIVSKDDSLGWISNIVVYKTNSNGNQIWKKNYFSDSKVSEAWSIANTSDGGYVITGETQAFTTDLTYELFLFKINESGDSLWTRHYGNPTDERGYHVFETSDKGFLITGATNVAPGTGHLYLVKTDQDGLLEWTSEMTERTGYKTIETMDGNFLLTGRASQLVKIDQNGDTLWTKLFTDTIYGSLSFDVRQTSDGGFVSVGAIGYGYPDLRIIKFTPEGNISTVSANASHLQIPITDFQTINNSIQISVSENITQSSILSGILISIDTVLHTSCADLEFTLDHSGVSDTLIFQAGGSGQNFINTRLFDGAQIPISQSTAPFNGFFLPYNPLSTFVGLDPNGDWTLNIYDAAAGNTGSLEAWGLKLFFEPATNLDKIKSVKIKDHHLFQNYPNPFNPTTTIEFNLSKNSEVTLKVFNILGEEMETLLSAFLLSGFYRQRWDASDLASGIYYCQLKAGDYQEVKKMVLMK
jgi:hypothetical protein